MNIAAPVITRPTRVHIWCSAREPSPQILTIAATQRRRRHGEHGERPFIDIAIPVPDSRVTQMLPMPGKLRCGTWWIETFIELVRGIEQPWKETNTVEYRHK